MICRRKNFERCVKDKKEDITKFVFHEPNETKAEAIAVDLVLTAYENNTYLILMFSANTPYRSSLIRLFENKGYYVFHDGSESGNINGF